MGKGKSANIKGQLNVRGNFFPNEPKRVEKVDRNGPCACGSGRKHKKCCGATEAGWLRQAWNYFTGKG